MGISVRCYACGKVQILSVQMGRETLCPACGMPLHVCLNCRFFDPAASHQCREPQAEWISDKEAANFCEWFTPTQSPPIGADPKRAEEARRRLEDLFKKPGTDDG